MHIVHVHPWNTWNLPLHHMIPIRSRSMHGLYKWEYILMLALSSHIYCCLCFLQKNKVVVGSRDQSVQMAGLDSTFRAEQHTDHCEAHVSEWKSAHGCKLCTVCFVQRHHTSHPCQGGNIMLWSDWGLTCKHSFFHWEGKNGRLGMDIKAERPVPPVTACTCSL